MKYKVTLEVIQGYEMTIEAQSESQAAAISLLKYTTQTPEFITKEIKDVETVDEENSG